MSRLAVVAGVVLAIGCSKSAGNQDTGSKQAPTQERIAVPGAGDETAAANKAADGPQLKLTPEEGSLAIEAPTTAKAGSEVVAKVVVTASKTYKVNVEFPTKLTFQTPSGVALAKTELRAGGADKAKGDAEVFDDNGLTFLVKLTPSASGSYTVNGSFKFAVCDRAGNACYPKKEAIAIQIAAK